MNITITTNPTGRSPESKFYFGKGTEHLDLSRPKYNKIGDDKDYWSLFWKMREHQNHAKHVLTFHTSGFCFRVHTNDDRHAQFVDNMFLVEKEPYEHYANWTIYHNTEIESDPKIYVHLNEKVMLIVGTTFLGEIKKGIFGILSFELPSMDILPMHCSAFTQDIYVPAARSSEYITTNLMFGLSGTGKTTLSSDPDYRLISDDEVYWSENGIHMIETGCYAKSEGLTPETHETIFNAVSNAKALDCLVVENPDAPNARLSYPITMVDNAYEEPQQFNHPDNIFFLTMDAEGVFPPITRISGETVREFFETGYTSSMPGTENGVTKIQRVCSPCYGSPFMPRSVSTYSNILMKKIDLHDCNVFLVNTGMDGDGKRFPLEFTRNCIKDAIRSGSTKPDLSKEISQDLKELLSK